MPKDSDQNLTGSFNAAARKTPAEAVLETVRATRRSLGFAKAIKEKDWTEATKLAAEGADPLQRSADALNALFSSDAPEAVVLAEKLDLAPLLGVEGIPYILAAQQGDLAKVEEGLQKGLNASVRSSMVYAALVKGHAAVADKVLEKLPAQEMEDNALFALLRHRPALYEAAGKSLKSPPDYIAHFYHASLAKDTDAMDLVLEKMIENRNKLPFFAHFMDDFDGSSGRAIHYADAVMKSGHLPAVLKFLDNFMNELALPRQTFISLACTLEHEQPGILKSLLEQMEPTAAEISFAVTKTVNNPETARFLMQQYPAETKAEPQGVLRALAQEKGDALQKAVEENGLALPAGDKEKAELLAATIHADNTEGEKWLLQQTGKTPEILSELQGNHNYKVIRRAVALGAETRFSNDKLFWKAVAENDRETVDAYPRNPPLSTETPWMVHNALRAAIKQEDFALLEDILKNANWDDDARKGVFGLCIGSAPAMQAAVDAGFAPPEKLDTNDTISIARGDGEKSLAWLAENAELDVAGDIATTALRSAVQHDASGMIEYLLAQGASLGDDATYLDYAIREMALEKPLDTLEKWVTRTEKREAPGLAEEIESGQPLFGGADSLAIKAAYADKFADIIKKAASEKTFDPALLVSTADAHGNTVLDILGAHGKLNDVFAVPALWKDGDAVGFIRDNSSKLYHDQCDFAGLKAAIDLLRLQGKGRNDRFKLK